jgi:hypothetical protein
MTPFRTGSETFTPLWVEEYDRLTVGSDDSPWTREKLEALACPPSPRAQKNWRAGMPASRQYY